MTLEVKIAILAVIVFVFNIPFGYWRENVKKFSLQWALAIHIPVPFMIALRLYWDIDYSWLYLFVVASFFTGQRLGATILKKRKVSRGEVSSNLIMDLLKG